MLGGESGSGCLVKKISRSARTFKRFELFRDLERPERSNVELAGPALLRDRHRAVRARVEAGR